MKLKQVASDFIVEEIPSFQIFQKEKSHKIYILEKKGIDTFEALREISSKLNVPLREIGFAGLKDKHAITRQYISIPTHYGLDDFESKNLSIKFIGFYNKKIKVGNLQGNKFNVVVRDIEGKELKTIYDRAENISRTGVPNYFDSQRFGSVFKKEFIAKYIIKRDFEKAVKIFLTRCPKSENKRIKEEKKKILRNWSNLDKISIRDPILKRVIEEYLETNSWLCAYKKVPSVLREIHINAYQSFIWNECIKEVLKRCIDVKKLYNVKYAVGFLIFYKDIDDDELNALPSTFPTISEKVKLSEFENEIVSIVTSREELKLEDFEIKQLTGKFFKSRRRTVCVFPEDFQISQPIKDELNSIKGREKYKLILSFSLPKGSYATIVTKKIFAQ